MRSNRTRFLRDIAFMLAAMFIILCMAAVTAYIIHDTEMKKRSKCRHNIVNIHKKAVLK